jgi:tRNA pseudouridine synthase 10
MNSYIKTSAKQIIDTYKLCDSCLGRLFIDVKKGISNKDKGFLIRKSLKKDDEVDPKNCYLCEGLSSEIYHFVELVTQHIKSYEFDTFLIGSIIDEDLIEKQNDISQCFHLDNAELLKMQMNREIGKLLEEKIKKTVSHIYPDITIIIDTAFDDISLEIRSLYLYGRYKKFKRGIPQTKWPCMICRGKGCSSCNYLGKIYDSSVEELIAANALDYCQGTDESFHGCGREDIDALMLGNGRPFVLEIKNPKKRNIDFDVLIPQINKSCKDTIEVSNLRYSDKKEIARLKEAVFHKTYLVKIKTKGVFNKEKLNEVAQVLPGLTIKQLTPIRVAHRRANKIRERKLFNCKLESVEGSIASLIIEAQSGTYIKELVSGDSGRTTPNISEMIGIPCVVAELDVIEIKGE